MPPCLSLSRHSRTAGIFFLQRRTGQTRRSHRRIPHRFYLPCADTGIPDESFPGEEHCRRHRHDPRHGSVLSLRNCMAGYTDGTDVSRRPFYRCPALPAGRRGQDHYRRRRRSEAQVCGAKSSTRLNLIYCQILRH